MIPFQTDTYILEAFNILTELTSKPMVKNSIQEIEFESISSEMVRPEFKIKKRLLVNVAPT